MADDFQKWWSCLKKHTKRSMHWLREAREINNLIAHARAFRYFTLCARPMIDVFMLAKEDILAHDDSYGSLSDVVFCEYDEEHYPEITEMIGIEGAGFPTRLESLVLFTDDDYTSEFPTLKSIQLELESQGEGLADIRREALVLKRQHLEFADRFPFDFLNLDFCSYYYPTPPGILKINETVDKIVELQGREGRDQDGKSLSVSEFALAVTCRFDDEVPQQAFRRLERIVRQNMDEHDAYSEALRTSRDVLQPERWREADDYDFFLCSWPKELLQIARKRGWQLRIEDYLHYERIGDQGNVYHIVCLVCRFTLNGQADSYLAESIRVLDRNNRLFIDEVDRDSMIGKTLLADLEEIVAIRNQRARLVGRIELPAP
jgi:hypothetical protein